MMKIDILTLFPEMFQGVFSHSILKRAQQDQYVQIDTHNFRAYVVGKHQTVDDYPYGGGAGMVLKVEPIVHCLTEIQQAEQDRKSARIILLDPSGTPFTQSLAEELSQEEHLIFICGHYEGYDERIRDYVTDEISLGDYILTGGELGAMVMTDAVVRLLPGVLGNDDSIVDESHSTGLLEYPQYTRPAEFDGKRVPKVLLSGHHQRIEQWRKKEALKKTYLKRPDLLVQRMLSDEEIQCLQEIKQELIEDKKV